MPDLSGIKYVICPGWTKASAVGGARFVSYDELVVLYDLQESECWPVWCEPETLVTVGGLTYLGPRDNGEYRMWLPVAIRLHRARCRA